MSSNLNTNGSEEENILPTGDRSSGLNVVGGHAEEDRNRALIYNLLSRVLAAPVADDTLEVLRSFSNASDGSGIGDALQSIGIQARKTPRNSGEEEFSSLFYGMGSGGEMQPYMSFYLTGFVYEKPLAALRDDLRKLGVSSAGLTKEPEDHIAFICEVMAGLILSSKGEVESLEQQKVFFNSHLATWATQFFVDLETAKSSVLYRPIGALGRVFMAIESEAFGMIGN